MLDTTNPWRNGSASDSRPEGWGFKSLWAHSILCFTFCHLAGRITHKGGPPCSTFIRPSLAHVGYLPGRGVSLIKKGLRLVWSRIIAL